MSVIRKALGRGAMQLSKSGKIATLKTPIQRSFSSILETREMGEEARYIRTQEHQRQAEIRANIERILALEEGHAEKTELVQMLGTFYETKQSCNLPGRHNLIVFFLRANREEGGGY